MGTLAQLSIEKALSYEGVREVTRNRGPEVDTFIREGGGLDPEGKYPWCAGFVSYCIKAAADEACVDRAFKRGASVLKLKTRNQDLLIDEPEAGCVFLILHPNGTGHTGFVVEVLEDGYLVTCEGNTGPGPAVPAKDREGDGVYRRTDRKTSDMTAFLRIA